MQTRLRTLAFLLLCLLSLEAPGRALIVPAAVSRGSGVVAEYGYRYYAPEMGRWLSPDPLQEIGGSNLYSFVSNDGLNGQDLLGCIDWRGIWDITKSGEIVSAGYRGARQGVGNVYKAGRGVVTAPSQFGMALGKEIGDYLYLPDEFDARWADRRAMLDALVNDKCYRQQAIDALKKEFGDSIADGSMFANLSVDILTSLAGVGIAKQLDRLNELIKLGKLQKLQRTAAKRPVKPYEVGTADDLLARSIKGDGLDVHHAGQAHPMEQLVPGYDRATGPAITVPRGEHVTIPTVQGPVTGTPRSQLAKDILDLRNNTSAPNSSLQELIDLNKRMYPNSFTK